MGLGPLLYSKYGDKTIMSTENVLNTQETVSGVIDDRLAQALEASNYRLTLNIQRENSKLKLRNKLQLSKNGGIFRVSQEFISFIFTLSNFKEEAVILDTNENPIKIENLKDFLNEVVEIFTEGMNEHLVDYEKFKKLRSTAKVISW